MPRTRSTASFDRSGISDAVARGTGLLVSVRDASEAADAVAGGADVIDVKEPTRGPMGRADAETIRAVVAEVGGWRPVTAAWGELSEACPPPPSLRAKLLKVGLSGQAGRPWTDRLASLDEASPPDVVVAPVAYADHSEAGSPPIDAVIQDAASIGAGWVVIDTFDKKAPGLLETIGESRLAWAVALAERLGLRLTLAGRLKGADIGAAAGLGPALVGVRGAVCHAGRSGPIDQELVADAHRWVACPPSGS